MSQERVSMVIPLWRHDHHLDDCINSILNQTHKNLEVIFVDNNATENVLLRISKYLSIKSHVIFRLVKEPIQGIASARQRGVLEAESEYVGFLDSDDLMQPNRLETQIKALKASSKASMAVSLYDFISFDGNKTLKRGWKPKAEMWAERLLGKGADPGTPFYDSHPSTMLFRKKAAVKAGLFDIRFNPFWYEDSEFSLRMHMQGPILLIEQPLALIRETSPDYRKLREGIVDWVRFKNTDLFFQILKNYFDPFDSRFRRSFSEIRARWLLEQSRNYFNSKEGELLGKKMIVRALKEFPFKIKNINYLPFLFLKDKMNSPKPEIPSEFNSEEFVLRKFLF